MNSPAEAKRELTKLIAWYRQNKPDVKTIALSADDFTMIRQCSDKTKKKHGYVVRGDSIDFEGFELRRKS